MFIFRKLFRYLRLRNKRNLPFVTAATKRGYTKWFILNLNSNTAIIQKVFNSFCNKAFV